jgi:hypothetical protein
LRAALQRGYLARVMLTPFAITAHNDRRALPVVKGLWDLDLS